MDAALARERGGPWAMLRGRMLDSQVIAHGLVGHRIDDAVWDCARVEGRRAGHGQGDASYGWRASAGRLTQD